MKDFLDINPYSKEDNNFYFLVDPCEFWIQFVDPSSFADGNGSFPLGHQNGK